MIHTHFFPRGTRFRLGLICILAVAGFQHATAQSSYRSPYGESAYGKTTTPSNPYVISYNAKLLYAGLSAQPNDSLSYYSRYYYPGYASTFLYWSPPADRDIVYANFKKGNNSIIMILLDDGSIYWSVFTSTKGWGKPGLLSKADPTNQYQAFKDIEGDALYVLSNSSIYISRNSGSSWQVDTTGLGFSINYGLTLDTLQYVYLASSKGVFKQHPDSSVWRMVTSFPGGACTGIFADRKNRVYASTYGSLYFSTNGGTNWTNNSSGLNSQTVDAFCDDAFGNVYARNSTHLWLSKSGTQAWVEIDLSILNQVYDASFLLNGKVFNGLSGDTLLFASTSVGSFVSFNQGTTWKVDSTQYTAQSIYGFVKTPSARYITSTSLGVYAKNATDQQWTKTFPPKGSLSSSLVFLDRSGILYTLGSRINPSDNLSVFANWKSSDGGVTWTVDSAGVGKIKKGQDLVYFVDETGVQHFAGLDTPAKFYSKSSGQNWSVDTTGLGSRSTEYPTVFGSDKRGTLYAATLQNYSYGMLYKQSIAGGTWSADTAGLGGAQIYAITVDRSGNLIAGTYSGVYRKTNGVWKQLQYPQGLGGYNAFVVSVDSTGALLAGFSTLAGLNYSWRGVYATRDNGNTWTRLGLDSVSIRGLVSYGDSTFAWSYANGLYVLRSNGTASYTPTTAIAQEFTLEQNYPNPFNPSTTIEFSIPRRDRVSLKLFDILGKEVLTLIDGELDAGVHRTLLDASRLSSGVYFYHLRTSDLSATKKIVLLK